MFFQVSFGGVRIPAFGAIKSPMLVSGGQLEVHVLSTSACVSSLTAATMSIGAHLAKHKRCPLDGSNQLHKKLITGGVELSQKHI